MSLAKGIYSMQKAKEYFQSVKSSHNIAPHAKGFLGAMLNKIGWCLTEMKLKLNPAELKVFNAEVITGDSILFDAVFDEMIRMSPEQRDLMEQVAIGIRKGEIQFVNQ